MSSRLSAIGATAGVAVLGRLLPQASPTAVAVGKVAGYVLLALVAAAVAATLYRFAPSREDARWTWITPGSIFAAVAWLILTSLVWVLCCERRQLQASYGSLGAVVAMLTWMYFSAYTFLIGAELNSEVEHQTAKDSTTGSPEPLGERGAWAADNVATDDTVEDRPEEQREGERLTKAAPKVADEKG